ncbi:MAG: NBR1-Ig-like domain-containing protein [Dehalococcoidia bacterium]|nr:NBR1-Ig-like domain-containing protein [Dehalococcoidia bacterium]
MRRASAPWTRLPRKLRRIAGLSIPAVAVLLLSLFLLPAASRGAPPSPEIRATTLSPVVAQNDANSMIWDMSLPKAGDTGYTLRSGATWGIYNSPIYQADYPFNAVALSWTASESQGSNVVIEVRASQDGQQWSEWFKAEPLDGDAAVNGQYHSQLIVAQGRYLEYCVTLYTDSSNQPPAVKDVKIVYIDSSQGPSITTAQGVGLSRGVSGVSQPAMISRTGWGSPEPNSSKDWPPTYRDWTKVALHDTVTKNDDPNPAATVRAIWYYHAKSLGWGDIGYNYLIDTHGNIYEGRFGGDNVTGGHVLACYNPGSIGVALLGDYRYADVPPAMSDAIKSLLATKTYQHNIDPLGAGNFGGVDDNGVLWQRSLPNIFAHRDLSGSCGNNHADPGPNAYGRLQEFRSEAWNLYPTYGEAWLVHNSPPRMLAGSTATVAVTVKNTGRALWSESNLIRLGYRWYGQDGAEVFQDGGGFQRARLSQNIPFGQTVMVNAQVTAPASPGIYTLQWDMLQEGLTWFSSQGNTPLNVPVTVGEPLYVASFVGQSDAPPFFPGDARAVWFDLKNTGTATWYRSGSGPVRLGTTSPRDRTSAVATAGDWPNPTRATALDQDQVAPGQVGRFTFTATAPAEPGVYRENFGLVAEGNTWFGPDLYLDFKVLPSNMTYLPELLGSYTGDW